MSPPRVRAYLACSLDGFIAGPDDELAWLDGPDGKLIDLPEEELQSDPGALQYADFIEDIGALLMGRRTYDVVRAMDVAWPYGSRPVLVVTSRPLDPDPPATVRAVAGSIEELVAKARDAAGDKDVYIDGGRLIRQAAEAGLIDELTMTVAPVALGRGISLFAGLERHFHVEFVGHHRFAGQMVQLRMVPRR